MSVWYEHDGNWYRVVGPLAIRPGPGLKPEVIETGTLVRLTACAAEHMLQRGVVVLDEEA